MHWRNISTCAYGKNSIILCFKDVSEEDDSGDDENAWEDTEVLEKGEVEEPERVSKKMQQKLKKVNFKTDTAHF